jgi:CBS domain-containing protein
MFLGGVGLGSAAAYALAYFADPRLGRRRRALAGAKLAHASRSGRRAIGKSRRGFANHARGLLARLRAGMRRELADDDVVAQRVRAALGRVTGHVSAIEASVADGLLTLRGPILEREHRRVMRTARSIRGVRAVHDCLERHRHSDVARLRQPGARSAPKPSRHRRCAEFMKTNPQTVRVDDSLQLAAELMSMANVGFLPVCDSERRVIGTVTDRDIVIRGVALGAGPEVGRVGDVMTRNVIACRPDDELADAEQFMSYYQVSRLVITDEQDVLLGVISLSDIVEREPAKRAVRTLRAVAAREAPRLSH